MWQIDDAAVKRRSKTNKAKKNKQQLSLIGGNATVILRMKECWSFLCVTCRKQDIFNIQNIHVEPESMFKATFTSKFLAQKLF